MQQEFVGDVEVVGVSGASRDLSEMEAFVSATGVGDFPHVADTGNDVWSRYGITSQPRFVFIDDDGTFEVTTGMSENELRERMAALAAT